MDVTIGTWHEESKPQTELTSYAADHIEHVTRTGDYPISLEFKGGYTCPMPYWLHVKVDSDIVGGKMYSGCGGFNYSVTEVEPKPDHIYRQMYAYDLHKLLEVGLITLKPAWAFLGEFGSPLEAVNELHLTWEVLERLEKGEEICLNAPPAIPT